MPLLHWYVGDTEIVGEIQDDYGVPLLTLQKDDLSIHIRM